MVYNLNRLFNAKAILVEEQQWYYLTQSQADKEVHTFPKSIGQKVNIIVQLEFVLHQVSENHKWCNKVSEIWVFSQKSFLPTIGWVKIS